MELTIVGDVMRGLGVIYLLAGLGALALALLKPKETKAKILWTSTVLILFGILPVMNIWERWQADAFAKEAWAYYRKMCAERAGEKIFKTFTGVKSVVVTKPLPPATEKDLYDQYWYGDPYSASATSTRSIHAAGKLTIPNSPTSSTTSGMGFEFVEYMAAERSRDGSHELFRIEYQPNSSDYRRTKISVPQSRFSLQWEDISRPEDRKYWVAASRLSIFDLAESKLIAQRIGFFIEAGFGSRAGQRRPWLSSRGPNTTCPESHTWSDRWFVFKVLNPREEGK